jgi:purine-nucleoside phosphorylase
LQGIIAGVGKERGIELRQGVYCGIKGPSYETAAEVEMIRRAGGDAIGMSTVNEASLAHALGMRVAGISCITNHATGIGEEKLTHAEVTEVAARVKKPLESLLNGFVAAVGKAGVI